MTPETVNLVVAIAAGVALGVIALSALIAALALWRAGPPAAGTLLPLRPAADGPC